MYPDCPTLRGQRHVEEMMRWVKRGGKAFLVFVAALPYVAIQAEQKSGPTASPTVEKS